MAVAAMDNISAMLRLFASVFQREADGRLLSQLDSQRDEIRKALGEDPLAGLDLRNMDDAVESLAIEYCRLFIGPRGHLPPVESIVRGEGQFWGNSTQAVVEFYRSMSMDSMEETHLLPDHISMELACLALLREYNHGREARRFVQEHLLKWLPGLIKHVAKNANLAFYPSWCKGLLAVLEELYGKEP